MEEDITLIQKSGWLAQGFGYTILIILILGMLCFIFTLWLFYVPPDTSCNENCRLATSISATNFIISTEVEKTITAQSPIQTATRQREMELAATIIYPTISYTQTQEAVNNRVNTAVAATKTQIAAQTQVSR